MFSLLQSSFPKKYLKISPIIIGKFKFWCTFSGSKIENQPKKNIFQTDMVAKSHQNPE